MRQRVAIARQNFSAQHALNLESKVHISVRRYDFPQMFGSVVKASIFNGTPWPETAAVS